MAEEAGCKQQNCEVCYGGGDSGEGGRGRNGDGSVTVRSDGAGAGVDDGEEDVTVVGDIRSDGCGRCIFTSNDSSHASFAVPGGDPPRFDSFHSSH